METGLFSDERQIQQFEILKESQAIALNLQNWHEFLKVLMRAGFRGSSMISSQLTIIYAYVMYLIGKNDYHVDSFELRNCIARWFFMTSMTGRYTSSPEGAMESDLTRLRSVKDAEGFCGLLNQLIKERLTEDFWNINLPHELASATARSPSLFAYYSSLNLLEAKVLFSKMKVSDLLDPAIKANKSPTERHHLFPRNYLKKLGITEITEVNTIANFALVEWKDNIEILDDAPSMYLPKYLSRFSEAEITQMYYWHALPKNWEHLDYKTFTEERRKLIAKVIRDGYTSTLY